MLVPKKNEFWIILIELLFELNDLQERKDNPHSDVIWQTNNPIRGYLMPLHFTERLGKPIQRIMNWVKLLWLSLFTPHTNVRYEGLRIFK